MAKENTHILFAHTLLQHFTKTALFEEITQHIDYYYLGSVVPDTFFYSADKSIELISEILHGKDGHATNEIIFKVLEDSACMRDIAFILGYITHCALDITIHPVVYYFSGNYYDTDPARKKHAVYMHRSIETYMDVYLNNPLRIYNLVNHRLIHGLSFEHILCSDFSISPDEITRTLRKQIFLNRIFASSAAYRVVSLVDRYLSAVDVHEYLGLFYGHVAAQGNCIPHIIPYRDIISGTEKTTSVRQVMEEAGNRATAMMEAAYGYSQGRLSRESLAQAIPGESLDTGKLHTTPDHIRYTDPGAQDM